MRAATYFSARPLDLDLAIVRKAVSEVEIDQALVRNASLRSHALEVLNHVFGKPHGHGLLELGSVRILARLHRGQIVFSLAALPQARSASDELALHGWPTFRGA